MGRGNTDIIMQLIHEALSCKPVYGPMAKGRLYDKTKHIRLDYAPIKLGQYLALKEKLRTSDKSGLTLAQLKLLELKQTLLHTMAEITLRETVRGFQGSENAFLCTNGAIVFLREQPTAEVVRIRA